MEQKEIKKLIDEVYLEEILTSIIKVFEKYTLSPAEVKFVLGELAHINTSYIKDIISKIEKNK